MQNLVMTVNNDYSRKEVTMDERDGFRAVNELTQDQVKTVDLKTYPIQPAALWLIPESVAVFHQHRILDANWT